MTPGHASTLVATVATGASLFGDVCLQPRNPQVSSLNRLWI